MSSKGQIVLPSPVRRRLGIETGDLFDAQIEGRHIVLIPRRKSRPKARVIKNPLSWKPVLTVGPDAPVLTHKRVGEMLVDFP